MTAMVIGLAPDQSLSLPFSWTCVVSSTRGPRNPSTRGAGLPRKGPLPVGSGLSGQYMTKACSPWRVAGERRPGDCNPRLISA